LEKDLKDVEWVSGDVFWACGEGGLILRTQDHGQNWTQIVNPTLSLDQFEKRDFVNLAFVDVNRGVFVGNYGTGGPIEAYMYRKNGVVETWTNVGPTDPTITSITDIQILGTTAYVTGEKTVAGVRQGVVLQSSINGLGVFSALTPMAVQPIAPLCTTGEGLGGAILTEIAVDSGNGEIWVGGMCGRIWHYTGGAWIERKSQTDAHINGMNVTPEGYVFASGFRKLQTQQVIVRWHP
jgi:hypothetical protein